MDWDAPPMSGGGGAQRLALQSGVSISDSEERNDSSLSEVRNDSWLDMRTGPDPYLSELLS